MSEKYMIISDMNKNMNSIADKIARRIRAKQRGWVFTAKDFVDLGTRATVDQTLSRLTRQGLIRRLDRGYYDFPKQHATLGTLSPDIDSLAQAVTAKSGDKAFPSGAMAANILGLSTQVPAKPVYLTNGSSRIRKIGNQTITLKHARVPVFEHLSDEINFILQALSYLGKNNIDDLIIQHCASKLSDQDIKHFSKASTHIPSWLSDTLLKIQQSKHGKVRKSI
jgi:DNA-binding transcriptional ArsR family regulator